MFQITINAQFNSLLTGLPGKEGAVGPRARDGLPGFPGIKVKCLIRSFYINLSVRNQTIKHYLIFNLFLG